MDEFLASGLLRRSDRVGGSVERARAAKVSCMRLIHKSGTTVRTDNSSSLAREETNAMTTALIVIVS